MFSILLQTKCFWCIFTIENYLFCEAWFFLLCWLCSVCTCMKQKVKVKIRFKIFFIFFCSELLISLPDHLFHKLRNILDLDVYYKLIFLVISNYCIEIVSRMSWFCLYVENPLYFYLHINEVLFWLVILLSDRVRERKWVM